MGRAMKIIFSSGKPFSTLGNKKMCFNEKHNNIINLNKLLYMLVHYIRQWFSTFFSTAPLGVFRNL